MACHDPRDYVLGQDLRVRILTAGPQTSGRHDLVDAFQLPDTLTPLHLHTRYEERLFDLELFASVSAELGDQILGPPGTFPPAGNHSLLTPSRPENEAAGNERDWAGTRRNETAAQKANCLVDKRIRFPAAPLRKGR
jgi:hypothetical protein